MADDKRTTPGSPDGARRRRPAPTIDLTATEIGAPAAKPAAAKPDAPASEPPPQADRPASAAPAPRGFGLPHLIAGAGGGAVVAAILSVLWLSGAVPLRSADPGKASVGIDAKSIDDLKDRLGKAEQALAKAPAGDAATIERLTTLENSIKAAGVALAALTHRADEIAGNAAAASKTAADAQAAIRNTPSAQGDIDALQKRIDALASAATATQEKVSQASSADRAARLALAAMALRDAVTRGRPFAPQLAAARALGAGAHVTSALEPFAASGVPNETVLGRDLAALLPAMTAASGANRATSGGFIDRLQANAERLVRVRPVDAPAGDDAAAVLARLDVEAARHDIAAALADIAKLPAKARAVAEPWVKTAQSRQAALVAAETLVTDSAAALGNSTGTP